MIDPDDKNDQHIYIDTFFLQSYLMGRNEIEKVAKDQVKKAKREARINGTIFIKFPFLVIAELINNLNRNVRNKDKRKEILADLFSLIEDEKIDIVPPKGDSLKIAAQIRSKESDLDITDILIVAQALCDEYSTILLIDDLKVLESKEIARIKKREGRFRPLQIKPTID